jgi:hypothetical protein
MTDPAAVMVVVRAQVRAWRGHLHNARSRFRLMLARRSATLLVISGGLFGIFGGWLVGRWCMGLVIMAEAAGMILLGLNQEDGTDLPLHGARTVSQVLDDELGRQRMADQE